MLLTVDCGNTHITLGCVKKLEEPIAVFRLPTDARETAFGYAAKIKQILEMGGIVPSDLEGAALSSVVPPVTPPLSEALRILCGKAPLVIGAGVKTGLHISVNDPGTVASDLVVAAVALKTLYPLPAIAVDMGTATTVTAVDAGGKFIGGAILPGVMLSLDALSQKAALLPEIDLCPPKSAIGANTVDCMRSGVVYGAAGAVDGLIDRFAETMGTPATVVATGGVSPSIIPHCKHEMILDETLTLKGLYLIWMKNKK